jgi:RNA recognition motif. (a.k.a. RRM, RBD, or RNP domain)
MDLNTNPQPSLPAYSFGGGRPEQTTRLFVGGLPLEVTESQLYNYFRKFGVLSKCEIPITARTKKKKFAYVEFLSMRDALAVLELPNHDILGASLKLEKAMSTMEIFQEQLQKSNCKLFMSGDLIASIDPIVISEQISVFGQVERVKKLRSATKTFNSCFVTMKSIADAEYLLEQKSLVLPILQKVTFKSFVPRVRSNEDVPLVEDLEWSRADVTSSSTNRPSTRICLRQFNYSTSDRFGESQRALSIRPGLWIISNIPRCGLKHSFEPDCSTYLEHTPLKNPSPGLSDVNHIRHLDNNLRYNLGTLPQLLRTNFFNAEPPGRHISYGKD